MKAAVVHNFDAPPHYADFDDPSAQPGEVIVTVRAAALSHLVRGQASGRHYSSRSTLPLVPGVDGVGTLPDGRRVYFAFPRSPYGAMAEKAPVPEGHYVPVPDDLGDVAAAAIANPGMSSWAALTARAKLAPGETVLINGATGVAGALAVRIARHLGAGRVIATGRNAARLAELPSMGADVVISLEQSEEELARRFREEMASVDVVLDYLWGKSAELLLTSAPGSIAGAQARRIRYVNIGAASGGTIPLPASALRSSGLELLGSGLGSVSNQALIALIGDLLNAARPANLSVEAEAVPLAEVESAWHRDTGDRRLVFTV